MKIIDLLCGSDGHDTKYSFGKVGNLYTITNEHCNLMAELDEEGEICYYVTGCYNSGCDAMEINLESLEELKHIAEKLAEEMRDD